MEGLQIGKSSGGWAASLSALAALASVTAAIGAGPRGVYLASGIGLALALIGLLQALRVASLEKPWGFPGIMAAVHAVLLMIGISLQTIFLSPLPAAQAKMPKLQTLYEDPDGLFSVRGPADWVYVPSPNRFETGVRIRPGDQSRYVGISEATVFVRRLESQPKSPDAFLQSAAAAFSEKQSERRLFELKTEPGKSLSGLPVIWSTISLRRFWIPLYQTSVFGVKDRRYLCSVSTTGLQSHGVLARIFCLGLFERIVITDRGS